MNTTAIRYDLSLASSHLGAMLLLAVLGGATMGGIGAGRVWFGREPFVHEARAEAARERIDPNTAEAPSLRRLPGVGPTRAEAIVYYRRSRGPKAFRSAADLQNVPGVGPDTVRKIAPFLSLPAGG